MTGNSRDPESRDQVHDPIPLSAESRDCIFQLKSDASCRIHESALDLVGVHPFLTTVGTARALHGMRLPIPNPNQVAVRWNVHGTNDSLGQIDRHDANRHRGRHDEILDDVLDGLRDGVKILKWLDARRDLDAVSVLLDDSEQHAAAIGVRELCQVACEFEPPFSPLVCVGGLAPGDFGLELQRRGLRCLTQLDDALKLVRTFDDDQKALCSWPPLGHQTVRNDWARNPMAPSMDNSTNEFHILFFLPEAHEAVFDRMMMAARAFFLSAENVDGRDWPPQRRRRKSKHTEVLRAATLRVEGEVPGDAIDVARSLEEVLRTTLDSAKLQGAEVRVFAPDAATPDDEQ